MDTELFNEKTIKRLCSNVKVSPKQKKNANEWIKLLESGSLGKERTNYFKFALYILRDILGYSIREDLDYEKANIEFTFKDSIGKTVLCIEAKGDTQDLFSKQGRTKKEQSTPFKQTWDNMGRIDTIKYGICTNYRDFILIDKSKGYSKYHFFDFLSIKEDPEKLKEFIAIFSKESIIDKEFIEKLYEKSIIEEREFTKEFYKLFHETRLMLIKEFQDNGATKDESIHFTQIFLNRLMFVFFAEDTGKLRQRLFEEKVLNILKADSVFSENTKLVCTLIKSIFQNLNEGSKRHNIFGFNGGLFKENIPDAVFFKDFRKKRFFDEIYQNSKIKKDIELDEKSKAILDTYNGNINPIIMNLLYLASFDFNTEVSVNILGHIFEQSISDLENIKEEKVLRRKKEGVYYTPDYITDYICRNTIITYLSKKGVNTIDKLIDEYSDNLEELETKFKNIKILDPACGSGSFLLKAVEVLLEIHREVQILKQDVGEYTAKKKASMKRWQKRGIKGDSQLTLVKWNEEDEAREIIEKNIFGVDINEESVEITKLSLFFKIVKKNKKLIDLSDNIKCGNSLIDNPDFAGEKAFNWDKEFPFKFDIIIGNPPYVKRQIISDQNQIKYFEEEYKSAFYNFDLYMLFVEKGANLLHEKGILGYILPSKFVTTKTGEGLRNFIDETCHIKQFVDFKQYQVFEDVTTYTCLIFIDKIKDKKTMYLTINQDSPTDLTSYNKNNIEIKKSYSNIGWDLSSENFIFKKKGRKIKEISDIFTGIETGADKIFILEKGDDLFNKFLEYEGNITHKVLKGSNVDEYYCDPDKYIVIVPYDIQRNLMSLTHIKNNFPEIYHYLIENKEDLENREKGKMKNDKWYGYVYPKNLHKYEDKRIIWPDIALSPEFTINENTWHVRTVCSLKLKEEYDKEYSNEYLLAILNSKLFHYYLKKNSNAIRGGYLRFRPQYVSEFPIVDETKSDNIVNLVKDQLLKTNLLNKNITRFKYRIISNFNIKQITKKINLFYTLEFSELIKEINRLTNNKITFQEQDELEDYFDKYKKEIIILQKRIKENEEKINQIVYELYDLNKEEIDIIEKSLNN